MKPARESTNSAAVALNAGWLAIGRVVGDLLVFALFILLARVYGADGLGNYAVAVGIAGFMAVLSDFGLYHFSIARFSNDEDRRIGELGRILAARLILCCLTLLVLASILFVLDLNEETTWVILLVSIQQVVQFGSIGVGAVFLAAQKAHVVALVELVGKIIMTTAAAIVAITGGRLIDTIAVMPISATLVFLGTMVLVRREVGKSPLQWDITGMATLLRSAMPFAAGEALRQIGTRIDVVLIAVFLGLEAVGIYNAAYRIVFMVTLLMSYAGITFLPVAARLYRQQMAELSRVYAELTRAMVLLGIPCAVGLWLVSEELVVLFFGTEFLDSAYVLGWLSLGLIPICLQSLSGNLLTGVGRQAARSMALLYAASLAIGANIIFIPIFGINGAIAATLIYEVIVVAGFIIYGSAFVKFPKTWDRILMAVTGSAAFVWVLHDVAWSLSIKIIFAVVTYVVVVGLFISFRRYVR